MAATMRYGRDAGAGLLRGGKTVGNWLSTDVEVLIERASARCAVWSRAKESEVEQLAEHARYCAAANRFRSLAALNGEERRRIETLNFAHRMMHQSGSDIAIEGEGRSTPRLIVSGWAARLRVVEGRRQVFALLLPGDMIAMRPHGETRPGTTVTAMTVVETVEAGGLLEMAGDAKRYPGIAEAVERAGAHELAFADNQIWRLGETSTTRRVAHLMAELGWRLRLTGLGNDAVFPMPLTCETIGDMLAVKPHGVRHALQRLRRMGLYSSRYCRVSTSDVRRAEAFAMFRAPETVALVSGTDAALVAAE